MTSGLEHQITSAFSQVPPPPVWCLVNSQEGEEPVLLEREFLDKTDWRALTPEFLDQAPHGFASALSFFSDEAFRYYLPAYMLADLREQLERVNVLFHLSYGLDDESKGQLINPVRYGSRTKQDHALYKFAMFDRAQAAAIASYLQHQIDRAEFESPDTRLAGQALENYWLRRSEVSA